jgi:hypothetical protein
MKYIKTTIESYNKYLENYHTDKISKDEKLYCSPFSSNHPLYEVEYHPKNTNINLYKNNNDYKFIFETNSQNEYRLDLIEIKPESKWNNLIHYSVSFTLSDRNTSNYHELTMLKEIYELFDRIMYLLIYFVNNINKDVVFVIGNPFDKRKDLLYMDFIESFKKYDKISIYKDKSSFFGSVLDGSDWAYYIKIE